MIAKCINPACGISYEDKSISLSNGKGITFINTTVTCPRCGGRAFIQDGTYDVDKNGVTTFFKSINKSDLSKLKELIDRTISTNGNKESLEAGLTAIMPTHVNQFKKILELSKNENFRFWITWFRDILIAFIGGAALTNSNILSNNNINTQNTKSKHGTSYSKNYEKNLRDANLNKMNTKKGIKVNNTLNNKKPKKDK